jgi:hypothetical protein
MARRDFISPNPLRRILDKVRCVRTSIATVAEPAFDPKPSLTPGSGYRRMRRLRCPTVLLPEGWVMSGQADRVTYVLIARIPTEGIEDFRAYEDAVLPLLPAFNGCLERRLRNPEGTREIHIVSFGCDTDFQNYRNDPRRAAQAWLLERSSAKLELLPMLNA